MSDDEFRAAAKAYAREHYAGQTVSVASDGVQIEIPWSGIKHAFNYGMSRNEAAVALKLGELLQTSKLDFSEPDRYGRNTILAVHNYKTNAVIDGKKTEVVLQIREQHDGKRYYDHYEIKRPAGQSGKLTKGEAHSSRVTGRLILVGFTLPPTLTEVKPTPQHDAPMLLKSHIHTYTRKDGTVVQEHDDSRQVHYHAGADIPTHELRAGTFTTPDREAAEQFARNFGHKKIHEMHIEHGQKVASEKDIIKYAKKIGMYEKGTPVGQYFERSLHGDANVQRLISYLTINGFRTATFDDGMSKHPTTVILWKNAMHPLLKAHVADYSRTTASGAVAYVREHEDSRVKAYGRKLYFVRNHSDLHEIRQARFGHLPNWGELSDHDRSKILDAEEEVHRRLKEDDAVRDHAKAKERERQKEAMRSGKKVAAKDLVASGLADKTPGREVQLNMFKGKRLVEMKLLRKRK